MKLVVTGATGHLGRAVMAALRDRDVVGVSRAGESVEGARGVAADLNHDACIDVLAKELGEDVTLVHLAAWHPPATATTTPEDRRKLLETNVLGTMRVLDATRRAGGARCVVYASTFEVYGAVRTLPIDESHPTYPYTDYGSSKLAGEHHLAAYSYEEGGVRTVSLRMPAIYGPGERTARALPNFLAKVAAGERPVLYGDGTDLRDQIHVRDAARAVVCALSAGRGVYNISDGRPHSVREIAELALTIAGMDGAPEERPRTKGRQDFHMDVSKAREELGFEAEIALEDGMREQLASL